MTDSRLCRRCGKDIHAPPRKPEKCWTVVEHTIHPDGRHTKETIGCIDLEEWQRARRLYLAVQSELRTP